VTDLRSAFVLAALVAQAATALAGPPALPPTPAPITALLHVESFTLDVADTFRWSAARPTYARGIILVIAVDPALVYPRQSAEPVLYVGDRPAQRINIGYRSGRVVALVPGDIDVASAPIWFGTPALPEQLGPATIAAERRQATASGIGPSDVAAATFAARRRFTDRHALDVHLAGLVIAHAPDETEIARDLRDR